MDAKKLRAKIRHSLRSQGFMLSRGGITPLEGFSKDQIRSLHAQAVEHKRETAKKALSRYEGSLLERFANGKSVDPTAIDPYLREVVSGSDDEKLFRYASLQWSIPVSSGYGRRLRFLVLDRQNHKLIGLIGLGDPVYSLRSRDSWIGWTPEIKRQRLRNVMDAFVLGAVQPYSHLLCGKLISMLVASQEIGEVFLRKYGQRPGLISGETSSEPLALITTLSALGRSSIYNRISLNGKRLYEPIGFSQGSGEFHFSNGIYGAMADYAKEHSEWTAKNPLWGTGSRNRREVIRKCLKMLQMSDELMYHGIKRQVYAVQIASNTRGFLKGDEQHVLPILLSATEIYRQFYTRWLSTRSATAMDLEDFDSSTLRIWS